MLLVFGVGWAVHSKQLGLVALVMVAPLENAGGWLGI
jgi:hypothetical protein